MSKQFSGAQRATRWKYASRRLAGCDGKFRETSNKKRKFRVNPEKQLSSKLRRKRLNEWTSPFEALGSNEFLALL